MTGYHIKIIVVIVYSDITENVQGHNSDNTKYNTSDKYDRFSPVLYGGSSSLLTGHFKLQYGLTSSGQLKGRSSFVPNTAGSFISYKLRSSKKIDKKLKNTHQI